MRFDSSLLPVDVPDDVYDPREDSLLLLDSIELDPHWRTALEVGCGSGLLSMHLAKAGLSVTAVDVNPSAVAFTAAQATRHGLHVDARVSDLFSGVRGRFDLVAFNPPYLPYDVSDNCLTNRERSALIGGERGFELAARFADAVSEHLNLNGVAYLVVLEEHSEEFVHRKGSISWTMARCADFDGERLSILKGVPQVIYR